MAMNERMQPHLSRPTWNTHGLTRSTIKVRTQDQATVRFRCASEFFEHAGVHVGQQVVVKIPAEAVLLGMAGTWPGSDRWNRWGGRIVLVEPGISSPMITVKLHGKSWTLKSTGPVVGHSLRPQAWEPVNIVIDPETVMLVPQVSAHAVRNRSTAASTRTIAGDRVWLRARIEAVRVVESGSILSLDVGGAPVSALVCRGQEAPRDWAPGLPVEIHVGQWEAWLKPHGDGGGPVFCRLSY